LQTFLPYSDFVASIKCLDDKRLGKQRVEAMQILNILTGKNATAAWKNHPAVRMWKGYEEALKWYHNLSIDEWIHRGKNNTIKTIPTAFEKMIFPSWTFDPRLLISHRCNLLRKDFDHYVKSFGDKYDVDAPYWWPVEMKTKKKQEEMVKYWSRKDGLK
jgi:hypothetical protein